MSSQKATSPTNPAAADETRRMDDEIDLLGLVVKLWNKRRMIVVGGLVAAVLVFGAAGIFLLASPKATQVKLEFQLVFPGADKGTFPNGATFNSIEIISSNLLREVYDKNGLEAFMEFTDFVSAISLQPYNVSRELIDLEYKAKLSDTKLSPPDRRVLEEEYRSRLQTTFGAHFVLSYLNVGLGQPPSALIEKALYDILATWAEQAERDKRVNEYAVKLYAAHLTESDDESDSHEEFLIWAEILDQQMSRLYSDINTLNSLPGASSFTSPRGYGLKSVVDRLNFMETFELRPLQSMLQDQALDSNKYVRHAFYRSRLGDLERDKDKLANSQKVVADLLASYDATSVGRRSAFAGGGAGESGGSGMAMHGSMVIPQLGGGFIDQIVAMAQESSDMQFRQNLVKQMMDLGLQVVSTETNIERLKTAFGYMEREVTEQTPKMPAEELRVYAEQQLLAIRKRIRFEAERLEGFLSDLSALNLDVKPQLYTIRRNPVVASEYPMDPQKALAMAVLAWMMIEAMIIGIALVMDPIKTRAKKELHT